MVSVRGSDIDLAYVFRDAGHARVANDSKSLPAVLAAQHTEAEGSAAYKAFTRWEMDSLWRAWDEYNPVS